MHEFIPIIITIMLLVYIHSYIHLCNIYIIYMHVYIYTHKGTCIIVYIYIIYACIYSV